MKRIKFPSPIDPGQYRTFPILMQNENGPCPLIAIANVLSLRGDFEIPCSSEASTVAAWCSNERLLAALMEKLLALQSSSESTEKASYKLD